MLQTQDECPAKQIIKQPLLLLDKIQFFLFNITYFKYISIFLSMTFIDTCILQNVFYI